MAALTSDRRVIIATAIVAVLAISYAVVHLSAAAFTAQTQTGANTWASGSVELDSDQDGSVVFNAGNIVPGYAETSCIVVSYTGSLDAEVRLFVTAEGADQGLATHLEVTIDSALGDHGTNGVCDESAFTDASPVSHATDEPMSVLQLSNTYATALEPHWGFTGGTRERTYRISVVLPPEGSNDAQGLTASTRFNWESRSSVS